MTAATETVGFEIRVTGDQPAAQKIERVQKSFQKLEQGGKDTAKSLNAVGERVAKVSSLLATADPVLGKLTGTLSKAAGAAGTLSMAVGGPAGLAAGGLIAAISLLSDFTDRQNEKTESMARGFKAAGAEAKTFASRLDAIRARDDKAAFQRRLQDGSASAQEFEAQIATLDAQLRASQKNKSGISQFDRAQAAEIERLKGALANAQTRERMAGDIEAAGRFGEIGDAPSAAKKKAESGQSAAALQLDVIRQQTAEEQRIRKNLMDTLQAMQAEDTARFKSDLKLKHEFEGEAYKRQSQMLLDIKRAQLEEQERMEAAQAAKDEARRAVVTAGMQNLAGNSVSALQKVAKGQKMTTAMFLESIGDTTVASGTSHILQGIALSVLNPAQGVPLIAAGGAEVAFGIALGAAASRGSGGSMSGGGGGRARSSAAPTSSYAEPTRRTGESEGPREVRSNIIVNVSAMVADEHAGMRVAEALSEAQRKRGLRLSPEVVGRV